MKNKIITSLVCAFGFCLLFTACSREDAPNTDTPPAPVADNGQYTVTHYLDGQEVRQEQIDFTLEGQEYLIITGTEQEPESREVAVMAFSSLERMLSYADDNHIPVRYTVETGDQLAEYAERNGYIRMYEQTGEVPDEFLEYCSSFFPDQKAQAPLTWHDACWTGGASWVSVVNTVPFMAPGWGNRVSRFYDLAIYGGVILYDRTFFRNRLLTWHSWGWTSIHLCAVAPWADNRTESAIH